MEKYHILTPGQGVLHIFTSLHAGVAFYAISVPLIASNTAAGGRFYGKSVSFYLKNAQMSLQNHKTMIYYIPVALDDGATPG